MKNLYYKIIENKKVVSTGFLQLPNEPMLKEEIESLKEGFEKVALKTSENLNKQVVYITKKEYENFKWEE